jgi:uncharacterized protein (TIGR02145 family)
MPNDPFMGDTSQNVATNLQGSPGILDVMDLHTPISGAERDIPFGKIVAGRADGGAASGWRPELIQSFEEMNATGFGAHLYWDDRGHVFTSGSYWADSYRLKAKELTEYPNNQSFPAFYNDDQDFVTQGRQPDIGDGDPSSGDVWGTWGGYYSWDKETIVDSVSGWEATVFLIDSGLNPNDVPSFDSARTDISIRRSQQFNPAEGMVIGWTLTRLSDSVLMQSGQDTVGQNAVVVIPDLTIYKDPCRLSVSPHNPADADLTELSLHPAVTLYPAFEPGIVSYSAEAPQGTSSVNVTASTRNPYASISGDGEADVSTGSGTVTIVVTSQDGFSTRTYTVDITVSTVPPEGSFTDLRDCNEYRYVTIGNQVWMAENLNYATDSGSWAYNNDSSFADIYGRLYNWETACEVCPEGWHLPGDDEWTELQVFLIANGYNYDGSFSGNKIGKSLASTSGWEFSPTAGHVGNDTSSNNSSGFDALPGGSLLFVIDGEDYPDGVFQDEGLHARFWSSSKIPRVTHLYFMQGLAAEREDIYRTAWHMIDGMSVRCVKDATLSMDSLTSTSKICAPSIHSVSPASKLQIYPNPVNNILTVKSIYPGRHTIEIISLNGQILYTNKTEGSTLQIDLSSLQKGIYIITVRSRDQIWQKKIIKL